MQRFLTSLTAAGLLTLAPTLEASPYSGLVVFGDSLSDAGQFPDPGGPAGSTLRFTNRVGPTYQNGSGEPYAANATMLLSERLGLGALSGSTSPVNLALGLPDGSNYAVGGYTTERIFDSITGSGDGSVVGDRVRNGYLQDVANSGQTLDPNTLFYVNGGGNDFLDLLILSPSDARQSARRLGDSVRALQGAGARYIVVPLLGDLSQTPFAFALGSDLSGLIELLVAEFNTELVSQLAGIDAQIIPLNLPLLTREVVENASAYGLDPTQNLLGSCFDGSTNTCLENSTYGLSSGSPDPSRLLFNDGVHPTSTGQQITADYAYSLLAAPYELTRLPEMAHGALRAQQDHLRTQWLADWADWQPVGQWRSFVSGGAQRQEFDRQERAGSVTDDSDGYSLSLGSSYRPGAAWRVGLALGLDKQQLDTEASEYELRSYLLTTFIQYQRSHLWADAAASAGTLDYADLQRGFEIGLAQRSEQGDSSGDLWAFSARLGVDFAQPDSRWHLGPFISADYARVDVDGYAEQGASATALTFADQERTSKRLGAGLQGRFAFGRSTQVFAEVAHEREYEDDPSELTLALNSLPSLDFTLPGYTPHERVNRASIGFNQQLTRELALRGGYSLRKAEGEDDRQQGVSLSLAWNW